MEVSQTGPYFTYAEESRSREGEPRDSDLSCCQRYVV